MKLYHLLKMQPGSKLSLNPSYHQNRVSWKDLGGDYKRWEKRRKSRDSHVTPYNSNNIHLLVIPGLKGRGWCHAGGVGGGGVMQYWKECHLGQQVWGFSCYVSQNQRGFLVQIGVLQTERQSESQWVNLLLEELAGWAEAVVVKQSSAAQKPQTCQGELCTWLTDHSNNTYMN